LYFRVRASTRKIECTLYKPKRKPLPKGLPRDLAVYVIPKEDRIFVCCNGELLQVGEKKDDIGNAIERTYVPANTNMV
jgi:transposase